MAGGNLIGELRESLNSKAIASGEIAIEKAGVQNYQIDFGKEVKVAADKDYYFVLWAENNDYVQWNYNPALKASAYSLNGDNWDSHDFDFELDILPLYSGDYRVPLMTIGDKNIGIQEIPSLDQYVTAVDVLLGKNNLEEGIAIATLYKGYGAEAIKVDDAAIDISKLSSSGQMVHLEF